MYEIYGENLEGKDFVIGDIHGQFHYVEQIMAFIEFDRSKDRLFSLGDLVDRGVSHHKIFDFLDADWFIPIRGNHEDMLIDSQKNKTNRDIFEFHFMNGGDWFYSDGISDEWREKLVAKLDKLPYLIEVPYRGKTYGLVHAEPPFNDWDKAKKSLDMGTGTQYDRALSVATWARTKIQFKLDSVCKGVDHVYVGHSTCHQPLTLGNVTFIDTGSGFGHRRPTIVELGTTYEGENNGRFK